ncbi:MAG: site-specific integrase [Pseudomonadota bacterium]
MKRVKTSYPGVFYREADRIGGKGKERVFYIVFKKDGKVIEEKVGRQYVNDMTPARAATYRAERIESKRDSRKEIREQERAAKDADQGRWTIARLWTEYKRHKPGLKGVRQDENRYKLYIEPRLGDKEPGDTLPLDADRIRLSMMKNGKSPQSVKLTLALLRRIANFGARKQLSAPLPFTIELPQVNNETTENLTPDELSKLLQTIETTENVQAANFLKMILFTGMRRGELFRLQWTDIDFDRGFILLRDAKGGIDQRIPLNDSARKLLQAHPRTRSPFVFPGRGGRQRTDIKNQVNKIKQDAGLPKDFRACHGLRHVFASMLASSGQVDMYTLQKLLTHKSPQMTQRYAHLRDETLQKASNVAANIIGQALSGTEDNRDRKTANIEES